MRVYDDLTKAMWGALFNYLRGYTHTVVFQASIEKLPVLDEKFAENLGTRLPGWKRHQKKNAGLPNALALSIPVPSRPGLCNVVLMLSGSDKLAHLDPASPFRREKWRPGLSLGDFYISIDQRNRGDMATTWRLTSECYNGLDKYWRTLAQQKNFDGLSHDIERAVGYYPMFGGVRRQLRRLIRGYSKLAARHGVDLSIDPENLPVMRIPKGYKSP